MARAVGLQLALPVWLSEEDSFDSFVSEDNDLLLPYLKQFIDDSIPHENQSTVPFCFIHALARGGKSHLLYASCHYANDRSVSHAYFDMQTIKQFPVSIILNAEAKDIICFDNLHVIRHDINWQIAIFDLLNKVIEQNQANASNSRTKVILTADTAPNQVGFTLPDLVSRLNWGMVFQIAALSDATNSQIIRERFEKRGLVINDELVNFLINRVNRDIGELLKLVDILDQRSLEAQRKLTIPFVKQVLDL